ncbi:Fe-S cluster assembly protein NifU [candidate division KSB1 bacterium]|nr:MAG: Fe-S cluster assembly protein NifU [candidate division KSB1 bacterium]
MWEYSDKVKDHFNNPRNVGEIEDPDGVGEVGSLACGDALKLTFKLDKEGRIADVKFKTFGCGSAIASSSALTEMIKGKTLDEALKITNKDIADYLDGLPEEKMHCSVMGREALEAAIANYKGEDLKKKSTEGKIVCNCFGVTEQQIARAVRENNLKTVEQVTNYTKAGGGCQSCHPEIEKIIQRVQKEMLAKEIERRKLEGKKLTNLQKIMKIQEIIEGEIRPALIRDGGDIEIVDIKDNKVYVALRGKCTACPSSQITVKGVVESKLKEFVSEDIEVEEVKSEEVF